MGDEVYISRDSQENLDWLRQLLGDGGEYQKVIGAERRDYEIAPSAYVRVNIDLLIHARDR